MEKEKLHNWRKMEMKTTFAKRGRLEIIYEILSLCRKPANKTRILYKCNLSYDQLHKYLKYMNSNELLTAINTSGRELFQITERGKDFLEGYEWIKNF